MDRVWDAANLEVTLQCIAMWVTYHVEVPDRLHCRWNNGRYAHTRTPLCCKSRRCRRAGHSMHQGGAALLLAPMPEIRPGGCCIP